MSRVQFADSYLYFPLSLVKASLDENHLPSIGAGFNHDGYPLLLLIITKITGISVEDLQFAPFGGIIFPILCLVLLRRFSKQDILALMMTIFVSYVPTIQMGIYNVFAYAWTYGLFVIFILSFYLLLHSRDLRWIIVTTVIFLGSFSLNWTTPTWIISSMFFIAFLKVLQSKVRNTKSSVLVSLIPLSLAFSLIYLTFGKVFYDVWIPKAIKHDVFEAIELFVFRLQEFAFGHVKSPEPYRYYSFPSTIQNYTTVMTYAMILFPMISYAILRLSETIKPRKLSFTLGRTRFVLYWALIFAGLFHLVAYSSVGNPSLRLILLISPLTTVISLEGLRVKLRHKYIYVVVLTTLSLIGFGAFANSMVNSPPASYATVRSSGEWCLNNMQSSSKILSDTQTIGKHALASGNIYDYISYDPQIYSYLIDSSPELSGVARYAIIDVSSSKLPVNSYTWKTYQPLAPHLQQILWKPDIIKVYDSGYLWVLNPME